MAEFSTPLKKKSSIPINIAFQGEIASYTYLASQSFFSRFALNLHYTSTKSLKNLFKSLERGEVTYGITPLESSSYGTIHGVYDMLLASNGSFTIIGEIGQIEELNLCVPQDFRGSELDLTEIYSHPHILECCSDFLDALETRRQNMLKENYFAMERCNSWDSAAACKELMRDYSQSQAGEGTPKKAMACICSREAAALYGLRILVSSIGNDKNAETRYVVIAKVDTKNGNQPIDPIDVLGQTMGSNSSTNTRPKRSIALALRNIPGAIFKMSSCFAFRNIDILKIESRPATISMQLNLPLDSRPFTQKHWDLIFYIDYEPSEEESLNAAMMTNLSEYCMWIRDLGYYQSGLMNLENKPANWSTMVDVLSC